MTDKPHTATSDLMVGVQDLLFSLDRHEIAKIVGGSVPADPIALADQIITYVLEKARSSEPDQRAFMEERISQLEDDLDEAQQSPWPDWARSILKTLKANGYDPVDTDGTVDLGEAFADYLEGISVSEDGLRKIVSEKNAEISRLRALNPSPQSNLIGWQDISTAPKDGRDLLLTSHDWNGDAVVGSFAFGEWREDASPSGRTLAPTYWMSIPPLSTSTDLESDELSEINAALKTIQSTCLQLQYDHSGRYGVETIEPLRDVARLINKLVWKQAHTPAPQPRAEGAE